jgi:agmatinase
MVDYGDCSFDPGVPHSVSDTICAEAKKILDSGAFLLSMGGDHSVSYPLLAAHVEKHGPVALIQFDAHSDTWAEPEKRFDHGSMFYHAAREGMIDAKHSAQVGIRTMNDSTHDFNVFDANWVRKNGLEATVAEIKKVVGDRPCYLTFDIDFLDPAFAPGTGTPVCGGFSTWEAQTLIRNLDGLNLVGADVVEVSPPFDHAEITALAGASVMLDIICLIASQKRRR